MTASRVENSSHKACGMLITCGSQQVAEQRITVTAVHRFTCGLEGSKVEGYPDNGNACMMSK